MNQEQFQAIMPIICADLIAMIIKKQELTETEAIKRLYTSKLYETLEQEDTKLWQYSTPVLYALLEQEWKTGIICYPDV